MWEDARDQIKNDMQFIQVLLPLIYLLSLEYKTLIVFSVHLHLNKNQRTGDEYLPFLETFN